MSRCSDPPVFLCPLLHKDTDASKKNAMAWKQPPAMLGQGIGGSTRATRTGGGRQGLKVLLLVRRSAALMLEKVYRWNQAADAEVRREKGIVNPKQQAVTQRVVCSLVTKFVMLQQQEEAFWEQKSRVWSLP